MKFILIGKAGSGKDTTADYLACAYGFYSYAFADKLKQIAQELYPYEWENDRRKLLQDLGAALRAINSNVLIDYVFNAISNYDDRSVITDCRYKKEYDKALKEGFITIKIECNDVVRGERIFHRDGRYMTTDERNHISEQLDVECDYTLDNNGSFDDLYSQIDALIYRIAEGG